MKKIIYSLAIILMSTTQMFAQTTPEISYLVVAESRVKSGSTFAANQLKMNASIVKIGKGVVSSRYVHLGESGRTYTFTNTENLGAYLDQSMEIYRKASMENPGVAQSDSANYNGPIVRSIWFRMNEMCQTPKDFDATKYPFRRVTIFTVPFDKQDEFEEAQTKRSALALKLGITTPYFVFKARFGYSTNTYMTFEPDESDIAYYTHRKERQEQKTNKNAEWQALNKITGPISTNVRIDQIYIAK